MDRMKVREIVNTWMVPTQKSSYMGGLKDRPVLNASHRGIVTDMEGKTYLDFQSGQMGAALGHQHPRIVATITETLRTMMHATNTMLNVPRFELHERLGEILPKPLEKSLFLDSGSDLNEARSANDRASRRDHGLIFQARGMMNVLRLVPPMTTTDEELDRALDILDEAFAHVASKKGRPSPHVQVAAG